MLGYVFLRSFSCSHLKLHWGTQTFRPHNTDNQKREDEPGAKEIGETVETILEAKETSKLREHLRKFVEWAKPLIANASQTAFLALNELIRLVGPQL